MFLRCVCVSLQDYSNALRVIVKGQATLKLITDKPTIKMKSLTDEVRDDDDIDEDIGVNFDDFI